MAKQGHATDAVRVVMQQARELRDRARRLRKEAISVCKQSRLVRQRNSIHRDYVRLSDVLDRIVDTGIVVEPWRRVTPTGIHLPVGKARLKTTLIQTYLSNEEIVSRRRKPLRLPYGTGHKLGILQPADFLDMFDHVLDKGIVVDSWQQIDALGIDVLGVETHVIPASIQINLLYQSPTVPRELPGMKTASAFA